MFQLLKKIGLSGLALAAAVAFQPIWASASVQEGIAEQARIAYDAKDWPKSVELYDLLTSKQPQNARAWYRLGTSLHKMGADEKAIAAFQKSLDAGAPPITGLYGIALSYASINNKDKAFEYLEKATQNGFNNPDQMTNDPELGSIRSDARFAKMLAQAKHNQAPCMDTAENRQFDFWVGEWNVVQTSDGQSAGDSKIELILGNCVIQENWTSRGNIGYAGKSYNVYNSNLKRWEQFWADNSAGMIHFYGNLKDSVMDYWTDEIPQPDGTKLKRHLQFIPMGPDKVRQFSQGSTDGGKTWNVEYDFTYNRKK